MTEDSPALRVEALVSRCVEKDREHRYGSATELARALAPHRVPDRTLRLPRAMEQKPLGVSHGAASPGAVSPVPATPGVRRSVRSSATTLAPAGVKPGAPQLPPGRKHRDEFFGEVETYRGSVSIVLPFELAATNLPAIQLIAVSQGCADIGVCYVPHEQKAELQLAALSPGATRSDAGPGLFSQAASAADTGRSAARGTS